MYKRATVVTVLDVARQPLWRYVKGRHRNCDDTCSFATNVKKYNFFFSFVAKHHVPIQLRWRPLMYRHRACRATSQCAFRFLVANVMYKMNPRFFTTKRWNRFFAIYVVRLALYVYLKNICDGIGGQDESNDTPLYPPLFWLDNIFNSQSNQIFDRQQSYLFLGSANNGPFYLPNLKYFGIMWKPLKSYMRMNRFGADKK